MELFFPYNQSDFWHLAKIATNHLEVVYCNQTLVDVGHTHILKLNCCGLRGKIKDVYPIC